MGTLRRSGDDLIWRKAMLPRAYYLIALFWPAVAFGQPVVPPAAGGPQAGADGIIERDAGPANHPPRTDSPQAVNRGTDGSAAGLEAPGATGITPQGMVGSATAGAREPSAPMGVPPPISR